MARFVVEVKESKHLERLMQDASPILQRHGIAVEKTEMLQQLRTCIVQYAGGYSASLESQLRTIPYVVNITPDGQKNTC